MTPALSTYEKDRRYVRLVEKAGVHCTATKWMMHHQKQGIKFFATNALEVDVYETFAAARETPINFGQASNRRRKSVSVIFERGFHKSNVFD